MKLYDIEIKEIKIENFPQNCDGYWYALQLKVGDVVNITPTAEKIFNLHSTALACGIIDHDGNCGCIDR